MTARATAAGFTLLEAMVALVIVALGMMAVNSQLNRYVVAASFIEEKTLASWIATNKVTELSVASTWPELGEHDDELDFAGRHWRLHTKIEETDVKNLHRADVSVTLADNPQRVLDKVSGLIEPPAPAGFTTQQWSAPIGGNNEQTDPGAGDGTRQ